MIITKRSSTAFVRTIFAIVVVCASATLYSLILMYTVALRLHFHAFVLHIVSVYCVLTSLLPLRNTLLFQFVYFVFNLVLSDEICLMYSSLLFGFWFLKA